MLSFRRDLDVAWSPGSAGRGNTIHVAAVSVEGACAKWSAGLVRYATALVGVDDDGDLVADAFAEVLQHEDFRRTVREPEFSPHWDYNESGEDAASINVVSAKP